MWPVRFCMDWRVLNLFCASVLELCSTEVESFVLIESSYSVDFALQFGKAWNRIFVGREFCNTFVLIRDSGLCLFVKKNSLLSENLNSNPVHTMEKFPVYLHIPWIGNVSIKFEKQITPAVKHCFFSVEPRVIFNTRQLLPATKKDVLPSHHHSNVIY